MIYYSLLALVYIYSLFSTVNFIYNRVQSIIEAVLLHVFFEGSGLFYQTLKPPLYIVTGPSESYAHIFFMGFDSPSERFVF